MQKTRVTVVSLNELHLKFSPHDLTESYHWMNKDVGDNSIPKEFITALSDIIDSTGVCILEYLRNTKEMCFPCTITRYQLVNNFEQLIFYERLIF